MYVSAAVRARVCRGRNGTVLVRPRTGESVHVGPDQYSFSNETQHNTIERTGTKFKHPNASPRVTLSTSHPCG